MQAWRVHKSGIDAVTEGWSLLDQGGHALARAQVFSLWSDSRPFRQFWIAGLREVGFDSYCWECPPTTAKNLAQPFECVFVSSPLLARLPPDPEPFSEHFGENCEAVSFESLGKDALLIAPCPAAAPANFSHLASFVATASEGRQEALWSAVGQALEKRISARPLWLSTAGLGVAWLHVRLDSRPKYYRHAQYTGT
jgi:Family of unknown function (DUF6940)